ncbi:hypothetical protein Golob_001107 [Gossypium lobatum]|uniref:Uncharacterized protein n=1 Tax=Gossypium lobatum TaxID=34289 RepID=A0A7J8NAI1_9ROSI|nr:hypothetical protein [Gossypium lobatum]
MKKFERFDPSTSRCEEEG